MTRTVRQSLLVIFCYPICPAERVEWQFMTDYFQLNRHGRILWIQYAIVKPIPSCHRPTDRTNELECRLISLRNYESKPAQVRARIEPVRFDNVGNRSHDRLGYLYCSR